MVMASYWCYTHNSYRMVVDGWEIAIRMKNKDYQQQDYSLFREDVSSFLFQTDGIIVIEVDEKDLSEVEAFLTPDEEEETA